MRGEPLLLALEDDEGRLSLDTTVADRLLGNPLLVDKPVAILSISGPERQGKSFLLNYILRFLSSAEDGADDPLGAPKEPLIRTGFAVKSGQTSQTRGLVVWSEPFVCRLPDHPETAILLMDTQGLEGNANRSDGLVFALSGLISTLQLYNVKGNFTGSDGMAKLVTLLRYTRSHFAEDKATFDNLMVVIRDWTLSEDFGLKGGLRHLEEIQSHPENGERLSYLRDCFLQNLTYYRFPFIGSKVSKTNFTGSLSELDADFAHELRSFIPFVVNKLLVSMNPLRAGRALRQCLTDIFEAIESKEPLFTMDEVYTRLEMDSVANAFRLKARSDLMRYGNEIVCTSNVSPVVQLNLFLEMRKQVTDEAFGALASKYPSNSSPRLNLQMKQFKEAFALELNLLEMIFGRAFCESVVYLMRDSCYQLLRNFISRKFGCSLFMKAKEVGDEKRQLNERILSAFRENDLLNEALPFDVNLNFVTDPINNSLTNVTVTQRIASEIDFLRSSVGNSGAKLKPVPTTAFTGAAFSTGAAITLPLLSCSPLGPLLTAAGLTATGFISAAKEGAKEKINEREVLEELFNGNVNSAVLVLARFVEIGGDVVGVLTSVR